jgi:hypothetical protein
MATKMSPVYGAGTNITITLSALLNNAARQSGAIDNQITLFVDAAIFLNIKLAAGDPAGDKVINVYAYGSIDGVNYTDNATGVDGGITLRDPTNLKQIGVIHTPDNGGLSYKATFESIAAVFGGILPVKWGLVIENKTGLAFATSGGDADFTKVFRGINPQLVTF